MQLWEFYQITTLEVLEKLTRASFNQNAAKTKQMIVVVARKDLEKKSSIKCCFFKITIWRKIACRLLEERKVCPQLLSENCTDDFILTFRYFGDIKIPRFQIIGLFKPIYRQARRSDMRIVAQKSAALAAQNFMISMAAVNYDTCPMEGFDSLRVKKY
jgi:nitroreductase